MIRALLLALLLPLPALAGSYLVIDLRGMDCAGCNKTVGAAFSELPFLSDVHASFADQAACGELVGPVDEAALRASLAKTEYQVVAFREVETCPKNLRGTLPSPWEGRTEGVDVVVISHGEEVDIEAQRVPGKYTLVDFGAPWCGPCHEAAEALVPYLKQHGDVAVRAVELEGQDAEASYAQPAVAQHLKYVSGIPWLIVYAPDGKVLLRTPSVSKAIAAIDRHRSKQR